MKTIQNFKTAQETEEDGIRWNFAKLREITLLHAIHEDQVNDQQLIQLTRYLFSGIFVKDFTNLYLELDDIQKIEAKFNSLYRTAIQTLEIKPLTPIERRSGESQEQHRRRRFETKRDEI